MSIGKRSATGCTCKTCKTIKLGRLAYWLRQCPPSVRKKWALEALAIVGVNHEPKE